MKARLQFANFHEQCDDNQWDRVVFKDEPSFTVRPASLKKRISPKTSTKFDLRNLVPRLNLDTYHYQYGVLSVLMDELHRFGLKGTLKQETYKEILESKFYVLQLEHMEARLTLYSKKKIKDLIMLSPLLLI